ncbi:hypothetical protein BH20VER1_BH20VER1_23040 [soil metagenome]
MGAHSMAAGRVRLAALRLCLILVGLLLVCPREVPVGKN